MRMALAALAALAITLSGAAGAGAQQEGVSGAGARTFKALLFLVPGSDPGGLRVENLQEVWSEGESLAKLRAHLNGGEPRQLQALTIAPGQDNAVVQYEDLTFRVSGLYRGPQKDRMYLKVSFDQAGQAAVKEFLAGLDESVIVAYPLVGAEGGSIIAVLVPTG
ncbi:MAG: hypothetical protein ABR599_03270 [Gemmatimonadota bacterium]